MFMMSALGYSLASSFDGESDPTTFAEWCSSGPSESTKVVVWNIKVCSVILLGKCHIFLYLRGLLRIALEF